VNVSRSGGVAIVTIDNPARRNALTPALADEIVAVFEQIDADPSIGATVIRGQGGSFCSGADLSVLGASMQDPSSEESYDALERVYRVFTRFGEMRTPTIAAIRGWAVGAGVNLAMAADVRIAALDARIDSGFFRIGLHPGGGHLQLLVQAAGRQAATAMAIFAQPITGEQAMARGLVWESLPDDEVEARATEIAAAAGHDPALARKTIQSLRITNPTVVPWSAALQAERAPQLWSLRRAGRKQASGPQA
jgi:enoyl-CoA hydratase